MLAFRFHATLLTHTIVANSLDEAAQVAIRNSLFTFGECKLEPWQTPDTWTKRYVNASTESGVIDTVPRFVLDSDDGPQYVDIDVIHSVNATSLEKVRADGDVHAAWIDACLYQYIGGDPLREYVAKIATERDPKRYALLTRALAGAWGLGPVPEWHAAILPALIALDIKTNDAHGLEAGIFELDRGALKKSIMRYHDAAKPSNKAAASALIAFTLDHRMSHRRGVLTRAQSARLRAVHALELLGWLPENTRIRFDVLDNGTSTCERAAS